MASITCGNCKDKHESVDQVKACYNGFGGRSGDTGNQVIGQPVVRYGRAALNATAKQVSYINSLITERDCGERYVGIDWATKSQGEASAAIRELKAMPFKTAGAPLTEAVPAGYYALDSATGNNDLDFYCVQHGKGRWAGRVFVKRVIGGRPDTPVRGAEANRVIMAIAEVGADSAAKRYGQEIGRCGRCNRHLTDETSRALGLGPDCASLGL